MSKSLNPFTLKQNPFIQMNVQPKKNNNLFLEDLELLYLNTNKKDDIQIRPTILEKQEDKKIIDNFKLNICA